ncbi:hypothetical protein HNE_2904 [Hyphomonas neptunium ATCC 15444]|uniref:Uncharacterized protein n=2 Tax=Hyphomonas TaxID=85 RepID=Q0BY61_HYPNA|nr:hypothetical protein HNE_2904 [Hyphomonas neptunium ATCC 15444]KCZ88812.1 hypothetical protein HHI_14879 [Hyphomonas hirschiana VP5]
MKPGQSVAPSANMRKVDRKEFREAQVGVSFEATRVRGGDTC